MGFLSRQPNSNEAPARQNPWEANGIEDDFYLLVSESGVRCSCCQRVVRKHFMENGLCPDCFQKNNGSESPAIERERNQRDHRNVGSASGQQGEAD